MRVKLIGVGDSVGMILPEDVLARLGVGLGDELYLTETPDGYLLSAKPRQAGEAPTSP